MIIQVDTCDPRDVKALQLAATAESWERLPGGAYRIPSQDGRRVYVVTPESCSCEDARAHRCKHRRGLAIYLALREAAGVPVRVQTIMPAPFRCRCSASGSQGQCPFGAETVGAMQAHYLEAHGWQIDATLAASLDVKYNEIAEQEPSRFATMSTKELFGRL